MRHVSPLLPATPRKRHHHAIPADSPSVVERVPVAGRGGSGKKATRAKHAPKGKEAAKGRDAGAPRAGTKTVRVVAMLQRKGGAALAEIMDKMGWQRHTARAGLSPPGRWRWQRLFRAADRGLDARERGYREIPSSREYPATQKLSIRGARNDRGPLWGSRKAEKELKNRYGAQAA